MTETDNGFKYLCKFLLATEIFEFVPDWTDIFDLVQREDPIVETYLRDLINVHARPSRVQYEMYALYEDKTDANALFLFNSLKEDLFNKFQKSFTLCKILTKYIDIRNGQYTAYAFDGCSNRKP